MKTYKNLSELAKNEFDNSFHSKFLLDISIGGSSTRIDSVVKNFPNYFKALDHEINSCIAEHDFIGLNRKYLGHYSNFFDLLIINLSKNEFLKNIKIYLPTYSALCKVGSYLLLSFYIQNSKLIKIDDLDFETGIDFLNYITSIDPSSKKIYEWLNDTGLEIVANTKFINNIKQGADSIFFWLFLKKKNSQNENLKIIRQKFIIDNLIDWFEKLKNENVDFCFPENINSNDNFNKIILKHDIHYDIDSAFQIALEENRLNICGIFFMMGPHQLNEKFYYKDSTWEMLREMQKMGHRIGFHLCAFTGALHQNGLNSYVDQTIKFFLSQNIQIRYGNLHGESGFKQYGISAHYLLFDYPGREKLNQIILNDQNLSHMGLNYLNENRISLSKISENYGIDFWLDNSILFKGKQINQKNIYISDNSGSFRTKEFSSKRFCIDSDFVSQTLKIIKKNISLILIHPQHYIKTVNDFDTHIQKKIELTKLRTFE